MRWRKGGGNGFTCRGGLARHGVVHFETVGQAGEPSFQPDLHRFGPLEDESRAAGSGVVDFLHGLEGVESVEEGGENFGEGGHVLEEFSASVELFIGDLRFGDRGLVVEIIVREGSNGPVALHDGRGSAVD